MSTRVSALLRRENLPAGGCQYIYWCEGCKNHHLIPVGRQDKGPNWSFDGNLERPTFSPSVLIKWGENFSQVCHHYVRDGQIQYLRDCTHLLAGKTLPLSDVDTDDFFKDD